MCGSSIYATTCCMSSVKIILRFALTQFEKVALKMPNYLDAVASPTIMHVSWFDS